MSGVFYYKEFNDHDLDDDENPLGKEFNSIIKDLKENKLTHQGNIKLISSKGNIKYLRAKLSDEADYYLQVQSIITKIFLLFWK